LPMPSPGIVTMVGRAIGARLLAGVWMRGRRVTPARPDGKVANAPGGVNGTR
jgi:hypothetical protein